MSITAEIEPSTNPFARAMAHVPSIGHLLVCLDRSVLSESCLPCARFVAEAFQAKITLLHVMASASGTREPSRTDALEWSIAQREAEQYLSRARISLGALQERTATQVTQGCPSGQIAAAAREVRADLTVLSRHGDGGDRSSDLGSTAQHILALASGSVLLAQPDSSAHVPPHRILVALDGSVRSESVLPFVADLARLHGAEVILVHVVVEPKSTAVLSEPDDLRLAQLLAARMQANAEGYLAGVRARLLPELPSIEVVVVRRNEERQALLDIARQQAADMLVLTAHGSACNVERPFGSVAQYLLAHARLPLFVYQDVARNEPGVAPAQVTRTPLSSRPPEPD